MLDTESLEEDDDDDDDVRDLSVSELRGMVDTPAVLR